METIVPTVERTHEKWYETPEGVRVNAYIVTMPDRLAAIGRIIRPTNTLHPVLGWYNIHGDGQRHIGAQICLARGTFAVCDTRSDSDTLTGQLKEICIRELLALKAL